MSTLLFEFKTFSFLFVHLKLKIGLGLNWPFPGAVQCDLFSITPNSHFSEITFQTTLREMSFSKLSELCQRWFLQYRHLFATNLLAWILRGVERGDKFSSQILTMSRCWEPLPCSKLSEVELTSCTQKWLSRVKSVQLPTPLPLHWNWWTHGGFPTTFQHSTCDQTKLVGPMHFAAYAQIGKD